MIDRDLRLIDDPDEMLAVEALQRLVWPGSETEIVPAHMMITAVHNGGIVIGAFEDRELIGFVLGFPGFYETPAGLRLKHCSHMLGVHPDRRNTGLGFQLKRAQWQMVRHQGIDRITWTYDPLLGRNAHLNITRLGAVCSTYRCNEYGELQDGLNAGLPTDRFQVDWWVFSRRVEKRLDRGFRPTLQLDQVLCYELELPVLKTSSTGWLVPPGGVPALQGNMLLLEIPPDFSGLKAADHGLALSWRQHTRLFFSEAFSAGYIVTDFIHDSGRSLYLLVHGESRLGQD